MNLERLYSVNLTHVSIPISCEICINPQHGDINSCHSQDDLQALYWLVSHELAVTKSIVIENSSWSSCLKLFLNSGVCAYSRPFFKYWSITGSSSVCLYILWADCCPTGTRVRHRPFLQKIGSGLEQKTWWQRGIAIYKESFSAKFLIHSH